MGVNIKYSNSDEDLVKAKAKAKAKGKKVPLNRDSKLAAISNQCPGEVSRRCSICNAVAEIEPRLSSLIALPVQFTRSIWKIMPRGISLRRLPAKGSNDFG